MSLKESLGKRRRSKSKSIRNRRGVANIRIRDTSLVLTMLENGGDSSKNLVAKTGFKIRHLDSEAQTFAIGAQVGVAHVMRGCNDAGGVGDVRHGRDEREAMGGVFRIRHDVFVEDAFATGVFVQTG